MRNTLWTVFVLWVFLMGVQVVTIVFVGLPWFSKGEVAILTMLTLFALSLLQEPWKE